MVLTLGLWFTQFSVNFGDMSAGLYMIYWKETF